MKLHKPLLASAVALFISATASYADLVVNITGATAFRAAAHQSIVAALGGASTQYAYSTATGAAAANLISADRAIFKGTIAGIPGVVTVRASWSGSAAGVANLVQSTNVSVPVLSTTVSTSGTNGIASFENALPKFAFSDVAQDATNTPTPALTGTQVGVVPFVFVAQEGAPANLANVTDQLFGSIYNQASTPLSLFTGNSADASKIVVPTGRANTSGTRIAILAETGYGINSAVQQYQPTVSGGVVTALGTPGNGGFSSNSLVRGVLEVPMSAGLQNNLLLGYLTVSDALQAQTNGAKLLTYNGAAYSENNVKNGQYSLWSYQWFYEVSGLTSDEDTFRTSFVATIPANLGTAGIPIPDMQVERLGGDGGPIISLF